MPSEPTLADLFAEMLTEYEIFVNNSEQLIKEAKAILRKKGRNERH